MLSELNLKVSEVMLFEEPFLNPSISPLKSAGRDDVGDVYNCKWSWSFTTPTTANKALAVARDIYREDEG